MASPSRMENSLVLRARGAQTLVDEQRSVRDTLTGVAPEGDCSLLPLDVFGELGKPDEGDYVAQSILIQRLMGR